MVESRWSTERKDQDNEKKEKDSKWKELRDKDRDNTPGERYKEGRRLVLRSKGKAGRRVWIFRDILIRGVNKEIYILSKGGGQW